MVLKLDRRYPLVWRTPTILQLGVDRPQLVIDGVTAAQEHLIAALVVGVARSGLDMIARTQQASPGEVDRLLAHVAHALEVPPELPPTATVEGDGATADVLRTLLGGDNAGFVVIVAHHVISPELHGRWLREDTPHLPVVYGDSVVRIGPIVEPGTGPCLYCLELHHTDVDPAWPAISAQLWGKRTAVESALVAAETAGIAARMVHSRLLRGTPGAAISIELDAASGERATREWLRHPDCQCGGITEARSENERASAQPFDSIRFSPRKDITADAHA